jgi:hypothetical protein
VVGGDLVSNILITEKIGREQNEPNMANTVKIAGPKAALYKA